MDNAETHQPDTAAMRRETEAYLKKIRQTIQDGRNLVTQAELRIAETDRLLEREGITREELSKLTFTEAQLAVVNEELKRRGLPPLEENEVLRKDPLRGGGLPPEPDAAERDGSAENRKRKFGVMMQQFRM